MGRISYGYTIQARTRRLLAALLDYVNDDISGGEQLDIVYTWKGYKQLVVHTKLRFLEELTAKDSQPGKLTKEHIREAIKRLEDFVGILTDNRPRPRRSQSWDFTLKLQSKDKKTNLRYFDEEWKRRKAGKESSTYQVYEYNRNYLRSLPLQNLPSQTNDFIGREEELKQLLKYMDLDYRAPYINIGGMGGVGKTALVVEAAYRCWEFNHGEKTEETPDFDAIIFTEAKKNQLLPQGILPGKQVGITLKEIFRDIANTLKDQSIIQTKPEKQEELVKKKLGEQNTLLIVDSFERIQNQEEVLRFLNELPRRAKGVITTRETAAGYSSIYLDSLSEEDTIQLIQQQAGEKGVPLTEKECQQIYRRFGGVPGALIYGVGQLASRYPLDVLLDEKVPFPEDLGRYCFASSVEPLRGTPSHRLLMSLAIFPNPPVKEAIAEVAGLQQNDSSVGKGLAQLLQFSLISQNNKRYSMLPLTREYVLDELTGNSDFEEGARERWVNWYLRLAQQYSGSDLDNWSNYYQLEEEEENLREVLRWCRREGRYENEAEEMEYLMEELQKRTSAASINSQR